MYLFSKYIFGTLISNAIIAHFFLNTIKILKLKRGEWKSFAESSETI